MRKFLSLILSLALIFSLSVNLSIGSYAEDDPVTIGYHFYDSDGNFIKSILAATTGNPRIAANDMNLVPDFIDGGNTVVLSWKIKGGPDTRYAMLTGVNANMTAPVYLDPLATMPKAELFAIKGIDAHADSTQMVINDGILVEGDVENWLPEANNGLEVEPYDPSLSLRTEWDFSNAYVGAAASRDPAPIAPRTYGGQSLFPYMVKGGQAGSLFTAFTGAYGIQDISRGSGDLALSKALAMIYALDYSQEKSSSYVKRVTDVAGFEQAAQDDKIAILQYIESAYALTPENYYELIDQFHDLGIRGLSFSWNSGTTTAYGTSTPFAQAYNDNGIRRGATNTVSPVQRMNSSASGAVWGANWPRVYDGTGAGTESVTGRSAALEAPIVGLTDLGENVIKRMEELGWFYDGIHTNANTVDDYLEFSGNPMLITHAASSDSSSGTTAAEIARLVKIARNGGVLCYMLTGSSYATIDRLETYKNRLVANGFSEAEAWDHIAIGTDFDGGGRGSDVSDSRYYYRFAKELLARGYSKATVEKVMRTNILRVIEEVQSNAADGNRGGSAAITSPTVEGEVLGRGTTLAMPDRRDPDFSANVSGAVSGRVIVDGLVVPSELGGGKLTGTLKGSPVQERYHVVTFEATDSADKVTRETYIFYTGHLPEIHKIEIVDENDNLIKNVFVNDRERINVAELSAFGTTGRAITKFMHWWTGEEYIPGQPSFSKLTDYSVMRSVRLIGVEEPEPGDIAVTGVSLDKVELELTVGDTAALTATIEPEDATNMNVIWTSSNDEVATVDSEGNVEAIAPGTATITVTTEDGEFTAKCEVTVNAKYVPVESVKIDGAAIQQLRIRNTKQFTATVNPTNATEQSVTWESSNPKIFTVDDEGLVKGVGTGSAKLIVTCGDKTSFIMVQVTA